MPEQQVEALFSQIEKNSRSEAVILRALSEAIDRFEGRLMKLPAKAEVAVAFGTSEYTLRFHRGKADWRLSVDPNGDPFGEVPLIPLKDAPVETRIEALGAFQPLLEEIAKSQASFQEISRDVLKTIRRFGLDAATEGESDGASTPF